MASTRAKKLGEFLKEQQEPFILDLYLLERGHSHSLPISTSKLHTPNASSHKRQTLSQISKLLTTLHKKLSLHNQSCILVRDSDFKNQHAVDHAITLPPQFHATPTEEEEEEEEDQTHRFSFSSASSSTIYNSCSDFEQDSPHTTGTIFHSQHATHHEKHHQRHSQQNTSVRMSNCGVLGRKKISEESLLSAAILSSLIESAKKENCGKELRDLLGPLKSKTLLQKAKEALFDCVREIAVNVCRKEGREELRGGEDLGRIIWKRTKELGGNETKNNGRYLQSLGWMDEWNELKFKCQVRQICVQIADAVLERVTCEIVSEMIQILPPTLYQ